MKHLKIVTLALFLLVFITGNADAQKRTTRKTTVKKTTTTRVIPPLAIRTAREKVEIQLSNVNDFVTKLGPIAQGLETAEADRKAGKLSAKTAASIEASKGKLVDAIRALRDGLSTLESEFRVKAELKKYLLTVQGITDFAANSEDSAIAGKFVAAKEPLREVAKKLTDTLAAMPR